MNTNSAVYVRHVIKNYGDKPILNELSMTVERGTIYGLLGSSGCGKTTLLSCIVGRKGIDAGDIWVLGTQKGAGIPGHKIGYMPQELALVEEFTVKDAIYYFGTIFNMKNKEINERLSELTKLLDLPPEDRFLKNCSGGEKRRVSIAVALVHSPELLILDEPTVGVDPVLREKIWDYLKIQVNEKKITVIITTHYIEETRAADKIGLMRNGKLLIEESPSTLLSTYQTETLEEVYFILSKKQELENIDSKNGSSHISAIDDQLKVSTANLVENFAMGYRSEDELTQPVNKNKTKTRAQTMPAFSLKTHRIKALLDKNWKQFYRNAGNMCFLLAFPLVQLWFFTNSIGLDPKNLNLGIVNNESYTIQCDNFNWSETAVISDYECYFKDLSCRFLTYLEHPMMIKVQYRSLPEAIEAVKHGEIVGALYIPSNFSESLEERVRSGRDADKWITDFGEVQVHMDLSNRQTGMILKYKLMDLFYNFQKNVFSDCNLSERLALLPPIQQHSLYGDNTKSMIYFLLPGMPLVLVYLLGSTMTSNIIVKEKLDGVWDRSIMAGVSAIEITLAHLLLEAAFMLIQSLECIIMLFCVLDFEYKGSLSAMFVLVYLEGLCGMANGFCISSICDGFMAAHILCTGGFLPMLLICGLIWPLEAMPTCLRYISLITPCSIPLLSFRNIMEKGWSLWHSQVIGGVGIILVWIIIFGISSIWLIKLKK